MKFLKVFGELVSPNDPELVEKTLARLAEQDTWNDVFSTKLIELLDNIDLLKCESRERLRSVESAAQTASESLNRAECAHKQASQSTLDAKRLLDQSTSQLARAQSRTEEATRQVHAAEQRLAAADRRLKEAAELAAVAERKQLGAAAVFRRTVRFAVVATALSWVATAWMAWIAFRPTVPLWAACTVSMFTAVAAVCNGS